MHSIRWCSALIFAAVAASGCVNAADANAPIFSPTDATSQSRHVYETKIPVSHALAKQLAHASVAFELPTSASTRLPREPVFFHLGAGYGALGQVDLSPCTEDGLDMGYVHLHVRFHGDGQVVAATLESDSPPSEDALRCVGEQLQAAAVPAFDGLDVTLSKSAFVAPGE